MLICCCLINTIIVILIEFWDFSWSLLCYTQVSVLILGIVITRGQYYWVLDIGCLSWYRSNPIVDEQYRYELTNYNNGHDTAANGVVNSNISISIYTDRGSPSYASHHNGSTSYIVRYNSHDHLVSADHTSYFNLGIEQHCSPRCSYPCHAYIIHTFIRHCRYLFYQDVYYTTSK